MKKYYFFGGRIAKTGIAVFLTAFFCDLLHWPPVFAVITSIVSIEPTVMDSLRKGIVRFPASAIGSAFAVTFIALFGDSPITYTAAAVFTILACFKLKLHDGLLVAALTSVAMVDVIHSNLFIAFCIRLGTTTIGLAVSAFVNFLIFPPKYSRTISNSMEQLSEKTGQAIKYIIERLLAEKAGNVEFPECFHDFKKALDKAEKLCHFQKKEWKFHRFTHLEYETFHVDEHKIYILRKISYHLGNLVLEPSRPLQWNETQRKKISLIAESLAMAFETPELFQMEEHIQLIEDAKKYFKSLNNELYEDKIGENAAYFSPELIILYELLSIHELIEEFFKKPLNQAEAAPSAQ